MKKTIAMILTVIMIVVMIVPVTAVDENRIDQTIAYERIDESTVASRKTAILAAREAVIYSKSWVADGVYGAILDQNGNVKEVLPQFSDIFPEDWDVPVERNSYSVLMSSDPETGLMRSGPAFDISPIFNKSIWLSKPTNQDTPPFCSFSTTGFPGTSSEYRVETVYTSGIHENTTTTAYYNVGYSNTTTGVSLGYAVNLENGEVFTIDPPANIKLGVRASSSSDPGDWLMKVEGKRIFSART